MVEADGRLKLLLTSTLDIFKVFEHIDMLFTCIQYQPYTVLPTVLLGSDYGVLGHLWSQNDMIMSWLRLTATSNCFPHPYWTYTKWLSTLVCYPWAYSISLTQLYPHYLGQILGFWVTCGVKNDVIMSWLRLKATSNCFPYPYYTYAKYLSTFICYPLEYSSSFT